MGCLPLWGEAPGEAGRSPGWPKLEPFGLKPALGGLCMQRPPKTLWGDVPRPPTSQEAPGATLRDLPALDSDHMTKSKNAPQSKFLPGDSPSGSRGAVGPGTPTKANGAATAGSPAAAPTRGTNPFGSAHLVGAAKPLASAAITLGSSHPAVPLHQILRQTPGLGGWAVPLATPGSQLAHVPTPTPQTPFSSATHTRVGATETPLEGEADTPRVLNQHAPVGPEQTAMPITINFNADINENSP